MLCKKFRLLVLFSLFLFSVPGMAKFMNNCLVNDFSTEVRHPGFPFGLTENFLSVEKVNCELNIYHQKLKYLEKKWTVDVCRGPVHIKAGAKVVEVYKFPAMSCLKDPQADYCKNKEELFLTLQDDGLIFAKGDKEDLNSSHGKVNCAYQLLTTYLNEGFVFSKDSPNPFERAYKRSNLPSQGATIQQQKKDSTGKRDLGTF